MLKYFLRKSLIIIICQSLVYSPLVRATGPLPLLSGDQAEPEISQKKYIKTVKKGTDVQITVIVTDNDAVKQVTLYYRTISSTKNYKRKTMDKIGDTDDYRATIKSGEIKAPGVEYYVEAIDNAGNKSSAPLKRVSQLALPPRDRIKPIISHEEKYINTVKKGADHQITVSVTDNVGVKQVTLYYRTIHTKKYERMTMDNIVNTDDYHATIKSDKIKVPGVEYYVEAIDKAGNKSGHSAETFSVTIDDVAAGTKLSDSAEDFSILKESDDDKGISKWVWIGLGVVLVGAVASSSSGGGDEEPAATGTVTITGPTP